MQHLDPLELDAARAGGPHPHLEGCAECRAEVEALRGLAGRLGEATRVDVPAGLALPALRRRRPLWRAWAAAAAVVLVAVTAGVLPARADIVDAYAMARSGRDASALVRTCVRADRRAVDLRGDVRFAVVDVWIDSGKLGLAAWQVEVTGDAKVVGVEGGADYDPAALEGGRIVLAHFTLDEKPPAGRVRVARLHMMESDAPGYAVKVIAAAARGGERIDVKAEIAGGTR